MPLVAPISAAAGDSADTASATAPVVVWLRNELRLCDNPLLQRGLQLAKGNLQLVVCLDPREFQATTAFGSPKVGELRKRFVEECLCDLRRRVAERGSRLLVQQKAPEEVLPALVSEGSTVLERAVERRVRKALEAKGAALEVVPAAGITDLVGPEELQRAGVPSGEEFPVIFQRFFLPLRPFLLEICQKGLSDAPVNLPSASGAELEDEELRLTDAVPGTDIRGGETAGLERMTVWLNSGFRSYKDTFRSLQGDYSSRLGAHLAYGCISPRRLVKEALSHGSGQSSVHVEHFVYEMCWRDFFRHTAAARRRKVAALEMRRAFLSLDEQLAHRESAQCYFEWELVQQAFDLDAVEAVLRVGEWSLQDFAGLLKQRICEVRGVPTGRQKLLLGKLEITEGQSWKSLGGPTEVSVEILPEARWTWDLAIENGHGFVVRSLLSAKAQLTANCLHLALHLAVQREHMEILDCMLATRADINQPLNGLTPLQSASAKGSTQIVRALLASAANVDAQSRDTGETALHLASNDDVARELFAAKASPDVADHLGAKASDVRCGASGLSKYENEN
eukprot:g22560.t1